MIICGYEVQKEGKDIYLARINNAPNDLCIKIREKINRFTRDIVYASYCNYYFWGKGHPHPYRPTDPYIADTEDDAIEYMLKVFKELMDEHDNDPEKFCWVPVYHTNSFRSDFCKNKDFCGQYELESDERGWGWAHDSYFHIILGTGKIITKEQFQE
jgi:hypothetical protein